MKRYIFDLDGTLCTEEENVYDAKPLKDRIKIVNKLFERGDMILIDSARGSVTGKDHYETTKKQLESWGVKFHFLRTGTKLFGDKYVDNRGVNDKDFF